MKVRIELTEIDLRALVYEYLSKELGTLALDLDKIEIQVKSKQNYKAEWETAAFRAVYSAE